YNSTIGHAGAARNYSLNGNEQEAQQMKLTASDLHLKLDKLKEQIKKDPVVQIQLDSLEKYINKRIDHSNRLINEGKKKGLAAAAALYQTGIGRDYNNSIFSFIRQMQTNELSTLKLDEQKHTGTISQLNLYLLGLLGFILILIIILVQKGRLDMSLRKKTEQQLKNFNLQLQRQIKEKTTELTGVFERITDGFIALDKNFCFTYVNKRAGEMTSRDPDTFIGKNMWEEFDKAISPQFRDAMLTAMKKQQYVYFEEYSPAYNRWFEDHLYPSPDGLSIFYRDITERKEAEEAIRTSEERYRALIEQASDAIMITDDKGNFIDVNAGFCNQFGYTKEELKGLNISKVMDPEQLKADPVRFDLLLAGQTIFRERRMMHKNGNMMEVEANVKMLPDGRMLAIARDITERKKITEEILKEKNLSDSVINSMPGIFYFYDHTGKFIRWNKRFEMVTGYSGEEIIRMHPLDFFEGEDKEKIRKCIVDVFEKGSSHAEALILSKNKKKTHYYFTGSSIVIDGIPYSQGIGTDITERKKAEEELLISREKLERSYEQIRQLASNIENIREEEKIKIAREIHDELGQQLTGLKMDISWVAKKLDAQDKNLEDKVKSILQLLDETVKSVRRIASELRPGILDDLGLIAAIEWQSQEFEKRSGIEVQFQYSGSDENIHTGISTGLFRIFQESLTNVARHSKADKVTATLELK
ncbi:MAG TPA: PAS domain S-box protein, partial [Chitinophagaceae bacterium]|nr:PAS domain S-box protein [Chitinophagaceae bacterium]